MKRTPLRRSASLPAKSKLRRSKPLERTASMAATDAQRAAVAGRGCIVCRSDRRIDPAHLIRARSVDAVTRSVWCRLAARVIAPAIAASWICCPTWSRWGGRSSPMPSATSG